MCYSPEVSIGTVVFIGGISLYLWKRNHPLDRAIALMLLVVVVMQALEFFLWLNLRCGPVNDALTMLIPVVLFLQPVALNAIAASYNTGWAFGYRELSYLYTFALAPILLWVYSHKKETGRDCTVVSPKGHLQWPRYTTKFGPILEGLYYFGITYPFITLKNVPFALTYAATSSVSYHMARKYEKPAWGSLWCHAANIQAILAVLLN
jgi:hypothetical protein